MLIKNFTSGQNPTFHSKAGIIFVIVLLFGCSSSNEEDNKPHEQINDSSQKAEEQESKTKEIANEYNAIFVKPYSNDWSNKYTYELQEAFENKKIIFEAKLVDISKINDVYQLQFGNHYYSSSTFLLTATYDVVNKISKSESRRFIVIATIKSINPLLSNKAGDEPLSTTLNTMSFGQSYLVKGSLDFCIIEQKPDN